MSRDPEKLKKFTDILFSPPYELITILVEGSSPWVKTNYGRLFRLTTEILSLTKRFDKITIDLIKSEIASNELSTLFRGNESGTKLVAWEVKTKLNKLLGRILNPIYKSFEETGFSSFDSFATAATAEETAPHREFLTNATKLLLKSCYELIPIIPLEVRELLKRVEIETATKFSNSESVSVGSFFFLRCIIPAITGAIKYDVEKQNTPIVKAFEAQFSSFVQRASTDKVSKVAQKVPERVKAAEDLNNRIHELFPDFVNFYKALIEINLSESSVVELKGNEDLIDRVCVFHNILSSSTDAVIDSIKDRFSSISDDKLNLFKQALLLVGTQQDNKNNETIGVIESAFLNSLKAFEAQYKRSIKSLEEKISALERDNYKMREQISILKYGAADSDVRFSKERSDLIETLSSSLDLISYVLKVEKGNTKIEIVRYLKIAWTIQNAYDIITGVRKTVEPYRSLNDEEERQRFNELYGKKDELIEKLNVVRETLASMKKKSITPLYVDARVADIEQILSSFQLHGEE